MISSGKRKREDFPSHVNQGGYIPQQDGAGDDDLFMLEVCHHLHFACLCPLYILIFLLISSLIGDIECFGGGLYVYTVLIPCKIVVS